MSHTRLTVLVEDLAALAAAAAGTAAPVLERCLARGRPLARSVANPDELRFALFDAGADIPGQAPVGALTAVADGLTDMGDDRYWLRVDPVTLTADLTRVFMTAHGLADVDEADRNALRACVADVLADAGYRLQHGQPDRWLLALDDAPPFSFMRMQDALGLDMAEALPGAADARDWRRLLTDIQIALHNAEVNAGRRAQGLREVNAAWIWGGGRLPTTQPSCAFDRVLSDHPVSQGLAKLAGCTARSGTESEAADAVAWGGATLFDWRVGRSGAGAELARLEDFFSGCMQDLARGRLELTLFDGGGSGWRLDRAALRRFWRRPQPLTERFSTGIEAPA